MFGISGLRIARTTNGPLACVIGDLSLVRALGICGIPVAFAGSEPHPSAGSSRYCRTVIATPSFVDDPGGAVRALVEWGRGQSAPPVIFYQGDHDLLALSRQRQLLTPHLRCVLPPQELVEDLVDKLRFAALAERLSLPVPPTHVVRRGATLDGWDRFPCVLKPAMRTHWFESGLVAAGTTAKAVRIEDRAALERVWQLAQRHESDFVLQAAIEGAEARILSYHAYVREGGEVVAEFTGKKVRTSPRVYGISTCVEITDDPEVKRTGRQVLERLGFSGVLKMDFKQDRDGRLYLLEINPRFNLWHHPATVAGVCLPALVYRDCLEAGSARPPPAVRAGVRWVNTRDDFQAFKEYRAAGELSPVRWLIDVLSADVREDLSVRDPLPGILGVAAIVARKLQRLRALRP